MSRKKNTVIAVEEMAGRLNRLESEIKKIKKHLAIATKADTDIAEIKAKANKPVKRSPKIIKEARGIIGIFEGPEDLSENMRAYLRGEK